MCHCFENLEQALCETKNVASLCQDSLIRYIAYPFIFQSQWISFVTQILLTDLLLFSSPKDILLNLSCGCLGQFHEIHLFRSLVSGQVLLAKRDNLLFFLS